MKNIWWILLGAAIMFILLKLLAGKSNVTSDTNKRLKELAFTVQARNLIMTNEFRELVKTKEFKRFIASAGEDYLKTVSNALAG
jgi:hypothetical protein